MLCYTQAFKFFFALTNSLRNSDFEIVSKGFFSKGSSASDYFFSNKSVSLYVSSPKYYCDSFKHSKFCFMYSCRTKSALYWPKF